MHSQLHCDTSMHSFESHSFPLPLVIRIKTMIFVSVDVSDVALLIKTLNQWTLQAL